MPYNIVIGGTDDELISYLPSEDILWTQVYSLPIYLSWNHEVLLVYVETNGLLARSCLVDQA